jgi:ATP-dependent DNA helicase RecG
LANEGGGRLLLGVSDKAPRAIVGTSAFSKPAELISKLFARLRFHCEVEEVAHPDGRVLVITIPSRPRGRPYELDGRYLMRAGSSLVPMTGDRLESIFREGRADWLEEPAKDGVDAQEVIDLLDTQAYFDLMKQPYPSEQASVIERLAAERLIDHKRGQYVIRRLGALLLAKRLEAFEGLRRKAMRVVVYDGNSKMRTKLDEQGNRGIAAGFSDMVEFVMAQLPQNEVVEHALRVRVKLVPEIAIRELAANSLVHQDFNIDGASPTIEVYDNRVEISNPGKPIVETDRFIDEYRSRNDRLADMMRRMGICEEKGSGVDQVVSAAEHFQLPAPLFSATPTRTVVTIFGPKPFEDMDRDDRVRACYQHCSLKWVMRERMTNQSLRERFKLPDSKASVSSQIIGAATEQGLIKADETVGASRKYARYLPYWA